MLLFNNLIKGKQEQEQILRQNQQIWNDYTNNISEVIREGDIIRQELSAKIANLKRALGITRARVVSASINAQPRVATLSKNESFNNFKKEERVQVCICGNRQGILCYHSNQNGFDQDLPANISTIQFASNKQQKSELNLKLRSLKEEEKRLQLSLQKLTLEIQKQEEKRDRSAKMQVRQNLKDTLKVIKSLKKQINQNFLNSADQNDKLQATISTTTQNYPHQYLNMDPSVLNGMEMNQSQVLVIKNRQQDNSLAQIEIEYQELMEDVQRMNKALQTRQQERQPIQTINPNELYNMNQGINNHNLEAQQILRITDPNSNEEEGDADNDQNTNIEGTDKIEDEDQNLNADKTFKKLDQSATQEINPYQDRQIITKSNSQIGSSDLGQNSKTKNQTDAISNLERKIRDLEDELNLRPSDFEAKLGAKLTEEIELNKKKIEEEYKRNFQQSKSKLSKQAQKEKEELRAENARLALERDKIREMLKI